MISVIPIKAWLATNGAFIAAVLATNKLESPEANTFFVTGGVTNTIKQLVIYSNGISAQDKSNLFEYFKSQYSSHWYEIQVPVWWIGVAVVVAFIAAFTVLSVIRNRVAPK